MRLWAFIFILFSVIIEAASPPQRLRLSTQPSSSRTVYIIDDEYSSDVASNTVNSTLSVPGPGTRSVTDSLQNKVWIASGKLNVNKKPSSWTDPKFNLTGIPRVSGRTVIMEWLCSGNDQACGVSDDVALGINNWQAIYPTSGSLFARVGNAERSVGTYTATSRYQSAIVLRTTGCFLFAKGGTQYPNWSLLWFGTGTASGATQYPFALSYSQNFDIDFMRVPQDLFLPSALVSDSFVRANGTIGTTDGNGQLERGIGGSGIAYSGSTWGVYNNTATNAPTSVSEQIALLSCSTPNVIISSGITYSTGSTNHAGLILGYSALSNYCRAYLTNNQVRFDTVINSNPTNLINGTLTYSANAPLIVVFCPSVPLVRLYYNNAIIGAENTSATLSQFTGGSQVGLYSTITTTSFTNIVVFARGIENQYDRLNKYSQANP